MVTFQRFKKMISSPFISFARCASACAASQRGKTFLLPLAFLSLSTTGQREVACLREAASA